MDPRLKTILANVLKLPPEGITPDVSRETCKAWTSLAHLLLVTQIESVFGIQMSTAQVVNIRTAGDIEKVVAEAAGPSHAAQPAAAVAAVVPPLKVALGLRAAGVSRLSVKKDLPAGVKPVALVTGSSRGIGAAAARALSRRGFSVVVHYLAQEAQAKMTQEALVQDGVDAILVQADLSKSPDRSRLLLAIDKRWGRLDALVNNAAPPIVPAALENLTREALQVQLDAHVAVPLELSQMFLPLLKKAEGAVIVNVLSIFIYDAPPEGLAAYVVAKSALLGLTRSMAREWAKYNIRVNSISPAITRTALSRGMDPAVVSEYGGMLEPAFVGEAIANLVVEPAETGADVVLHG